jgi:hypothetical protein
MTITKNSSFQKYAHDQLAIFEHLKQGLGWSQSSFEKMQGLTCFL